MLPILRIDRHIFSHSGVYNLKDKSVNDFNKKIYGELNLSVTYFKSTI